MLTPEGRGMLGQLGLTAPAAAASAALCAVALDAIAAGVDTTCRGRALEELAPLLLCATATAAAAADVLPL